MTSLRVFALGLLAACSDDSAAPVPAAAFPENYPDTYVEVRDCRKSGDHELAFVRILADPQALEPYQNRAAPFPDGAVILKEEYDLSDASCAGPVLGFTVMVKASAREDRLGWSWQRVDAGRRVTELEATRCQNCHLACNGTALGYDYTCAEP